MEGFAQALARRASDCEKLLARPRKLLVPDDRTGLLSSPALMFMEDVIDEVNFLMLYETVKKKNPFFPY